MVEGWLIVALDPFLVGLKDKFVRLLGCLETLLKGFPRVKHFIKITNIVENQKVFEDRDDPGILVKYNVVHGLEIVVVLFDCEFLGGLTYLIHVSVTFLSWN